MAIELGSPEFWEKLASDPKALALAVCSLDLTDIETALERHPGLVAWVTGAYEVARGEKEQAKHNLKRAKARALINLEEAQDPEQRKKSASVLKAEVEFQPEVEAAQQQLFAADAKCSALRAMTAALDDRSQMLVQIAAKRRQESREYS